MARSKKNNTKTLVTLGAIAAAGYALTRDGNPTMANQLAGSLPQQGISEQELLNLFRSSPRLLALLKGEKGEQGAQGQQGVAGAAGDAIRNASNSLLNNGSFELGTKENWSNPNNIELSLGVKNIATLQNSGSANTTDIINNSNILYCFEFVGSTSGEGRISGSRKDQNGDPVLNGGFSTLHPLNGISFSNSNKERIQKYFGGNDSTQFNQIGNLTKFWNVIIQSFSGESTFEDIVLRIVSLGEPVPDTLPWLPTGQMVYDPTDGTVGRYNGATVDYFTMQP